MRRIVYNQRRTSNRGVFSGRHGLRHTPKKKERSNGSIGKTRGPNVDILSGRRVGPPWAKGLLENLEREIERTLPLSLVLDFSGVTFMDSSGIAVALRGWQRMRELGGAVTLYHVAQQPRKVFEASGVGRMVTIV